MELLIKQSRIWAKTLDDALLEIRDKYGDGKLSIRECNIQSREGFTWFEYYLDVPEAKPFVSSHYKDPPY